MSFQDELMLKFITKKEVQIIEANGDLYATVLELGDDSVRLKLESGKDISVFMVPFCLGMEMQNRRIEVVDDDD